MPLEPIAVEIDNSRPHSKARRQALVQSLWVVLLCHGRAMAARAALVQRLVVYRFSTV